MKWFVIGCFGFCGVVARYGIDRLCLRFLGERPLLPTTLVNLLGCLIIGCIVGMPPWGWDKLSVVRPAVVVGFLGGLTTFSAFAAEAFVLALGKNFLAALLYVTLLPLACVLSAACGYLLVRAG